MFAISIYGHCSVANNLTILELLLYKIVIGVNCITDIFTPIDNAQDTAYVTEKSLKILIYWRGHNNFGDEVFH